MAKFARDKGKRGERLVIDWLQPIVDEVCDELGKSRVALQRNTVQSDEGGSDIVGLRWLAAEVKNVESQTPGNLLAWWAQCVDQAEEGQTPVLFYTKARAAIRVRMWGWVGGHFDGLKICPGHACLVDLSAEDFEDFLRARLREEWKSWRAPKG